MKQPKKIFLEPEDWKKLEKKADTLNFTGKGSLSRYIEKVAKEPIVFMDSNARTLLDALDLKTNSK